MKAVIDFKGLVVIDVRGLEFVEQLIPVKKINYSDDKIIPDQDREFNITIVKDSSVKTSRTDQIKVLEEQLAKKESESSANWMKGYNMENENKKLKEELEALKKLCPHKEEETK